MVPKARRPACAAAARAIDVIEQPGDLACGEIRIEQQPGRGGDPRFMACATQIVTSAGGAPVLPDDGVVDRLAAGAIPDEGGLALVGDADAGDVAGAESGFGHGFAHGCDRRRPDFVRIVLDQARRRIDLPQFLLRRSKRPQRRIECDRPRRRRALIDGDECGRQDLSPGTAFSGERRLVHQHQFDDCLVGIGVDGGHVARRRPVIIAGLHHRPRLGQHRHQAVLQRFR